MPGHRSGVSPVVLVVAVLLASGTWARPSDARPSPAARRLCGPTVSWDERQEAARQLAREGTLVEALAHGCPAPAYEAALPVLEEDFARLCRTDACLGMLEWLAYVAPEEPARLAERHARVLVPLVETRVREAREPRQLMNLLSQLLVIRDEAAFALAELLMGSLDTDFMPEMMHWGSLPSAPESPLLVALLEGVRRTGEPRFKSTAEVWLELLEHAHASSQAFGTVMNTLPCGFLLGLRGLPLRQEGRLAALVAQEGRCGNTGVYRERIAELAPEQVIQELEGASCEVLARVSRSLGWADAGRAGLLFPWLVRRCPQAGLAVLNREPVLQLTEVWFGSKRQFELNSDYREALAPHLVRLALAPGNVEALGNKREVLKTVEAALKIRPTSHEVYRWMAEAVTAEPPVVEWFGRVGRMPLSREELRALFEGPLRSRDVSVRVSAARVLAEVGVTDIPAEAARACFAQVSAFAGCRSRPPRRDSTSARAGAYRRWQLFGEPLPELRSVRISHAVPVWEQRCSGYRLVADDCPTTICGGTWPLPEEVGAILRSVTGQDVPDVDDIALRCPALTGP